MGSREAPHLQPHPRGAGIKEPRRPHRQLGSAGDDAASAAVAKVKVFAAAAEAQAACRHRFQQGHRSAPPCDRFFPCGSGVVPVDGGAPVEMAEAVARCVDVEHDGEPFGSLPAAHQEVPVVGIGCQRPSEVQGRIDARSRPQLAQGGDQRPVRARRGGAEGSDVENNDAVAA